MSVDRFASPPAPLIDFDKFSGLLHDLSQPLTALYCTLELALQRDDTVESFRRSTEAALANAARLQRCLLDAREMREADDPGDISQPIRADRLLMRVWEELLPLAETANVKILPMCEPIWIEGNEEKLAWALFSLMNLVLSTCSTNDVIELREMTYRDRLEVFVTSLHTSEADLATDPTGWLPTHQMDVLRKTFAAVGGKLISTDPLPCRYQKGRNRGRTTEASSWCLQLRRTNAPVRP